jgi:signal transduction histidine kinase
VIAQERPISDSFLHKWQDTTNVMAHILDVPAGLIMRVLPEQIEVLVSSHTPGNPYEASEKANLNTGLYCETVMATRSLLQVPNALADAHWKDNPDVALNMISYLGLPLLWPDDEVFGTICVLDNKERVFHEKYIDLLREIKCAIEADFKIIVHQEELLKANSDLICANDALSVTNESLTSALSQIGAMQGELIRHQKMSALGRLVAGIAHELNTPIGNGLMVASTLKHNVEGFVGKLETGLTRSVLHEFVDGVEQGADILVHSLGRAAELVDSFKQIAVDQSSVRRRRFDLKRTLEEVLLTLGPSIRQSGHRIVCDVPADIALDSYPGPLEQVLANLINNALLHAFAGIEHGTVTIVAQLQPEGWVRLTVADDGVGIPQANLTRVFDPFFTTRLGQGGSGLGLHAVYNQVNSLLCGTVRVDSEPGRGARFTLHLPCVAPAAARSATTNATTTTIQ